MARVPARDALRVGRRPAGTARARGMTCRAAAAVRPSVQASGRVPAPPPRQAATSGREFFDVGMGVIFQPHPRKGDERAVYLHQD